MNGSHVADQLMALISGNLKETDRRTVTAHLELCDQCRTEYTTLMALWDDLGKAPSELPSRSLERDVRMMIKGYEASAHQPGHGAMAGWRVSEMPWFRRPAVQVGFALCLLLAGVGSGYVLRSGSSNDKDIAQLHEEVRGLSNLLTVSLLKQESASDRLKGVSWGDKLVTKDPEIEAALINTMKHDRNVNVRLAALDALSKDLDNPSVRNEIIRSFPEQTSPLMQIALVDVLTSMNDSNAEAALQRALDRPDLRPEVRERIHQGLEHAL
ncbi:MAG TPA: HEAT repeat domain-containing protein [Bacteroidota bacterium]|nr:HEAT repeat domain-containing protein [Bacteroidota bacterium]